MNAFSIENSLGYVNLHMHVDYPQRLLDYLFAPQALTEAILKKQNNSNHKSAITALVIQSEVRKYIHENNAPAAERNTRKFLSLDLKRILR